MLPPAAQSPASSAPLDRIVGVSRAPRLLLVTDAQGTKLPLLDLAREAAAGGVDAIYLRDVALAPEVLAGLVREIRQRTGDGVAILVNGGPEVALATGAWLHLRERDMNPIEARAMLGPHVLIGKSVHSPKIAAASSGADYVLAGHVYPSSSKPGLPPLGLDSLAAIAAAAPCPTLAIGGMTPERVADVVRAGAAGVAVIGAIAAAADPRAAAAALRSAIDQALEGEEKPSMQPATSAEAAPEIAIVVNGKPVSLPTGATVHDLLASKHMTDAMAIVERNGEIVPRAEYPAITLQASDVLEVVHAVGGG